MYDFNKLANRKEDKTRKWDRNLIEAKYALSTDDYIPMWIADMDFEAPDFILESFKRIINNKSFCYTYSYSEFYESVIEWYKRKKGCRVEKDWITLTYGTVSTMHYLVQAFTNEADKVIINTPVYDPFRYSVENNNRVIVRNQLINKDNRYYIDFELLEKQLIEEKPKIMLFCNPHNPSGRVWNKEEIELVSNLCLKNNTLLVFDEVHSDQIHMGNFYSGLCLSKEALSNIILLSSANKSFNFGGLKTSYSIIPNDLIRDKFRAQLLKNAITSPNVFGIDAIISSYKKGEQWLNESTEYIYNNYKYITEYINDKLPCLKYMEMESSYLLWINIEGTAYSNSKDFVKDLAYEQGVILEPGANFGFEGDKYIRMNLGTNIDIIKKVMDRIFIFISSK